MPSNASPHADPPFHPRLDALDAALTQLASCLDMIFHDTLKQPHPSPPTPHLKDYRPEIRQRYEDYMRLLSIDGPHDDVYRQTQIYAFERAVFELAASFAYMAQDIAMKVDEDNTLTDLEVKRRVTKELGDVVDKAKEIMQEVMRQDVTGRE